jgi:hypothetical protein
MTAIEKSQEFLLLKLTFPSFLTAARILPSLFILLSLTTSLIYVNNSKNPKIIGV